MAGGGNELVPGGYQYEFDPANLGVSPDLAFDPTTDRGYGSIYRGSYNPLNPIGWTFTPPSVSQDAGQASASAAVSDPFPNSSDFYSPGSRQMTPEQLQRYNATVAAWQARNPSGTSVPQVQGEGQPAPDPNKNALAPPTGTGQNVLAPPVAPYVPYTGPHPDIYNHSMYYGVDPELALTTARIESNFGQDKDRPGSQYKGVFQLGDNEWASMGGTEANRYDRATQVNLGTALLARRQQQLADRLGRTPSNYEIYLAHNQGVAGAAALINNPNMTAKEALMSVGVGSNLAERSIAGNGGQKFVNAPASEYVKFWNDTYNHFKGQIGDTPENVVAQVTPRIGTGAKSGGAGGGTGVSLPPVNVGAQAGPASPVGPLPVPPPPMADPTGPAGDQAFLRRALILSVLGNIMKGVKFTPVDYDPFKVAEAGTPPPVNYNPSLGIGGVGTSLQPNRLMESPLSPIRMQPVNARLPEQVERISRGTGGSGSLPISPYEVLM